MSTVYIAVGSNLGDREVNIQAAKRLLSRDKEVVIIQEASIIETEPLLGPEQDDYLNTIWQIETELDPFALLELLLAVENQLGRRRSVPNAPRTIDLDILFFEDLIYEEGHLVIPHPRLHEREFILELMMELNPNFIHPKLNQSIFEIRKDLMNENRQNPQATEDLS